ncbi:MAG: hypothetical protein QX189_04910 [Methylococcales bacterium]
MARLTILTKDEINALYAIPTLDDEERLCHGFLRHNQMGHEVSVWLRCIGFHCHSTQPTDLLHDNSTHNSIYSNLFFRKQIFSI